MINGVDVLGTMGVFATGFILGALFFFTMRYMVEDEDKEGGEE